MARTKLSTKGQMVLPKSIRDAKNWHSGTELEVVNHPEGVLLKLVQPRKKYKLEDLYGILKYDGPPVSIEDMNKAVDDMFRREWK